jgi:hypothetical protein
VGGWQSLGENVGSGLAAGAIAAAFMGSTEHRVNILSPVFKQVGVGVVAANGLLWVTEDFRQPVATAPRLVSAVPAPAPSSPTAPSGPPASSSAAGPATPEATVALSASTAAPAPPAPMSRTAASGAASTGLASTGAASSGAASTGAGTGAGAPAHSNLADRPGETLAPAGQGASSKLAKPAPGLTAPDEGGASPRRVPAAPFTVAIALLVLVGYFALHPRWQPEPRLPATCG